jgi:energy-coupling factor transport system ATP-binding protein
MKSICFQDFSFKYLHQEENALTNLSLDIDSGSIVGVIVRAGAGKSTLVKAINGLVPKVEIGYQEGDVVVEGLNTRDHEVNQMAHHVGIVMQNPEVQIFSLTVWDDIAFGPANLGVPREDIFRRVQEALVDCELDPLANRNPNDISGGEQQSLAIAGILAMEPRVIGFDEPISMLDPLGKQRVMSILQAITQKRNTTSLITESGADIESVAEVVDRLVAVEAGRVILDGKPAQVLQDERLDSIGVGRPQVTELVLKLKTSDLEIDSLPDRASVPVALPDACRILSEQLRRSGVKKLCRPPDYPLERPDLFGQPVVEVENLHHFYNPEVHALKGVSLTLQERQIVGIIGQNGSGKTTLARHLVGLLKPTNKDVQLRVKGEDILKMKLDQIIRRINYVFQNPDDQLFAETIWDEIAFAPRMLDLDEVEVNRLTDDAMRVFGLTEHQDRYIYGLDEDLKTYLAISCILPLQPDVLLIDEPTTGLDTQGEVKMMESLRYLRDELGKTIVIITHNMKTIANHCDRVLVMSKGNLILDGPPRQVFTQTDKLLEGDILPPQITRLGQMLAPEFGCPQDVLTVDEMAAIFMHSIATSTAPMAGCAGG